MNILSLRRRALAGHFRSPHIPCLPVWCGIFLVCALAAIAADAHGQDRFWITSTGGDFASSANWSATANGAGGASIPAAANVANFSKTGAYTVNFAANVTNSGLAINNGAVTFALGGKAYTLTGATSASIGATLSQTGSLILKDGILGVDTAGDLITIGSAQLSTGNLTVSSAARLGNGTIVPDMFVGQLGSGTMKIESNGRADVGFINLGQSEGATGTVNLTGANAVLDASKSTAIGVGGTGTLNIQTGGTMRTGTYVVIGHSVGSSGTATISGLSSRWTQGSSITIAHAGSGGMSIQSAAQVDTAGEIAIGNQVTGVGTAVVTGLDSTWNMASVLKVGVIGLGNFAVSSGAHAHTAGTTTIASAAMSEGNVAIAGTGSRWATANVIVGIAGTASVSINSGGVVNTNGNVTIASAATGVGKATVTGSGSAWNITGGLNVAALGSGTLTVESDGILNATGALTIGDPAGSQVGTLNFNGGTIRAGSFTRAAGAAFNWTDGTLLVNGGVFNNAGENLTINGVDLDDVPALRLSSGAQSLAANLPNLTIGSNHQGAVIVSGGSSFQTTTTALGAQDGGTGSLHVEGNNSSFSTTGDLGVGGSTSAGGGLGSLTLGPGGAVTAGATLRLWNGGTITLSGGTVRFNSLAANGGRFAFNSGTVQSLSTFNANTAALDAIVGSTRVLGFGRKVDSLTNAFNLQSNFNVTGGTIAGSVLTVSSGVLARFEAAGTGTFTAGIVNSSGARVHVTDASLNAGTTFTNSGEVQLSGTAATINGTGFNNSGLVTGSGRVNSVITNNTAGELRVEAGQRLEVLGASGASVNNGLIDVDGGTIEFGRTVTNSSVSPSTGLIAARGATLRFHAGLSNSGSLTFSAGVSDVFGDVTNFNNLATPGRIVVTGGAQANFYDDVVNNGAIQVSAAGGLPSTAVFLGSLSGNGVSGGGHVFIEGDARPGFSPGTMAFGGDVSFGPLSSLNIELSGTTPGTQYDRVTVANSAAIDGDLEVTLLSGYRPSIGSSFQVFSAVGGLTGTFAAEALPELAGGASWNVEYGASAVTLEVGGILGDFNHDGRVDTADYTVWRDQLGTNALASDASGNGSVDQADYNIWRANFGQVAAGGGGAIGPMVVAPVPEPSTPILMAIIGAGASFVARRRVSIGCA